MKAAALWVGAGALLLALAVAAATSSKAGDFYTLAGFERPVGSDIDLVGAGIGYDFGPVRLEASAATASDVFHFSELFEYSDTFALEIPEAGISETYAVDVSESLAFDYKARANTYLVGAVVDGPELWRVTPFAGYAVGIMAAEVRAANTGEFKAYGGLSRVSAGVSVRVTDHVSGELAAHCYDGGLSQLSESLAFEFGAVGASLVYRW